MASTDPEIKDGFTLPAWMKTKPVKDFEPFAASPPGADDTFFYIKYPKSDMIFGKSKIEPSFREVLNDPPTVSGAHYNPRERDWSKHTKPCQEVIHGLSSKTGNISASKGKEDGKDNDFQNDGASCGSSVVKVAQKMITSSQRGFSVASASQADDDEAAAAAASMRGRRGSRSLPVTPLHTPPGSPNSRRRKFNNRYFTSPFEPVEDGSSRSWLTMALLGYKKDLAASTSTLAEEDALEARLHGATLAESVENLGPAPKRHELPIQPNPTTLQASTSQAFRPKPSELREMNFWSPTSM